MKLGGDQIPPRNRRREGVAVSAFQRNQGGVLRRHIIAVYEIDVITGRDAAQERGLRLADIDRVPANLRNLQSMTRGKLAHRTRKEAKPLLPGSFLARIKKHLESDANPEEWPFRSGPGHDFVPHSGRREAPHAVTERADPRQHQRVHLRDFLRRTDKNRLASHMLKGLLHASQIPYVVIHDADHASNISKPVKLSHHSALPFPIPLGSQSC